MTLSWSDRSHKWLFGQRIYDGACGQNFSVNMMKHCFNVLNRGFDLYVLLIFVQVWNYLSTEWMTFDRPFVNRAFGGLCWWKKKNTTQTLWNCFLSPTLLSLAEFILLVSIKGLSLHNPFLSKHFIFRKGVFFYATGDHAVWPHLKAMVPQKKRLPPWQALTPRCSISTFVFINLWETFKRRNTSDPRDLFGFIQAAICEIVIHVKQMNNIRSTSNLVIKAIRKYQQERNKLPLVPVVCSLVFILSTTPANCKHKQKRQKWIKHENLPSCSVHF